LELLPKGIALLPNFYPKNTTYFNNVAVSITENGMHPNREGFFMEIKALHHLARHEFGKCH